MENSSRRESQEQRRYRLRQYVRQRRNNMNIEQRQQELARRRLTRHERNNGDEAQPSENNIHESTNTNQQISTTTPTTMRLTSVRQLARSSFQQQFRTGSIGNTVEEISTTTSTRMRLTSLRQLARSSFRQQFHTGSIGNTLEQISTTTLTPMRLTSVRQLARSSFRQQFHRADVINSTRYQGTHDNEAGPSHHPSLRINNDYNFGTTTYDGPPINQSGPSHINADDTAAGYNFGETHYNETSYNEARPSPFHTHEPIGGGQFSSTTCHVVPEQGTSMTYTFHSRHNSARNFRADRRMIASQLPTPTLCTWCNARLFHHETENMCCLRAKVWLQQINAPQQLLDLIVDYSDEGRHFRQHIRGYNHIFAFTSLGVHLDNTLAATGRGIYTFRAQGSIYHNIGGLHPNEGDRPRFMQLYIYDTDHELQNRMLENPQLHENVVSKLQHILHLHNPFVHVFRQLALRTDVHQCSLIIKEPTATSGIAATLLPGGQTAHSRFKIPLNPDSSSVCSISKQSDLAKLITQASTIVWDEAPMQFPVRLSFALTINKAQGQTIPNVGIYLPNHVFGHGQLYVALSRGVSKATTKILIKEGKIPGEDGDFTKNIIFYCLDSVLLMLLHTSTFM
ncbi:hypothetical protein Lal_00030370 [Lupinus albus]|nr:hypothetical protein Lal_00030370 [Lupinus albus]